MLLNGTGLKAGVNEKGVGGRSPRGCGARLGLAFRITTAMKHLLHSGAAILLASFISGCATHVTMIGPARPPISPAAVRIYENPPRHYQQIAIINSSVGTTWLFPDRGSLDEAIADLRREAAALGANGVLLQAVYDRPVGGLSVGVGGFGYGRHNFYGGGGSVGGPLINRRVQAIAIYVHR
ncbi:MAG: hypothetical protein DMF27_02185 [Verrucomicrobia bacterium]|nr:MAG: hypothetical protein DMF27_02185 [Verrucomicrobiota bacterium]